LGVKKPKRGCASIRSGEVDKKCGGGQFGEENKTARTSKEERQQPARKNIQTNGKQVNLREQVQNDVNKRARQLGGKKEKGAK